MTNWKTITTLMIAAVMTGAMASPVTAQDSDSKAHKRQQDKNNMRNLGYGLGGAAAYQILRGKTGSGLVLGAGAAYAAKKYEDQRKAQRRSEEARRRASSGSYRAYHESSGYNKSASGRRYRSSQNRRRYANSQAIRRTRKTYPTAAYHARGGYPTARAVEVLVNKQPVRFTDSRPTMIGNRIYVPARSVLERLGAGVTWDPVTRLVTAKKGTRDVVLPLNSYKAKVDNKTVSLDAPARIINGRTMVPLRFLSESFGANVAWNAANHRVSITS